MNWVLGLHQHWCKEVYRGAEPATVIATITPISPLSQSAAVLMELGLCSRFDIILLTDRQTNKLH